MSEIQINTISLPDGTTSIEINDGSKPTGYVEDLSSFKYERSNIPQNLIDECEKLSEENGIVCFIFDKHTKNVIDKNKSNLSTEEKRDIAIDDILDDGDKFYIGSENEYNEMPSRFAYYDTETKVVGRYNRYDIVLNFFKDLGFQPGLSNLGPEFEQSFSLRDGDISLILRIKPNLIINITCHKEFYNQSYDGIFSKEGIYKYFKKVLKEDVYKKIIRDKKINDILL